MRSTSWVLACAALLQQGSLVVAKSAATAEPVYGSRKTLTLKSDGSKHAVKIIDFGENFEGHPTFEVVSSRGNTSVFEVSFAESRAALDSYMVR